MKRSVFGPDGIHLRLDVGARGIVKQKWDFREVLLGIRATVDAATEFLASIELSIVLENDRFREARHQALPDSQVEGLTFLENHS